MSKKRQSIPYDPQGQPDAELTTLSYNYPDSHFVPGHFHKEDQLVFAAQGVMTIETDRGIWVVPPLRAVWIPAREAHSIRMSGQVSMRTLYFRPKATRSIPKECFVTHVSPFLREMILHLCSKKAWKKRSASDRRYIEIALEQLARSSPIPLTLPQPKDARAKRVAELLRHEPGRSDTLAKLCKTAGGSKRTIERAFLKDTNLTFGKWRQQLRLLHSLQLLAAGEKVTTVALETGYSSPSAFISLFKKNMGHTPFQYFS